MCTHPGLTWVYVYQGRAHGKIQKVWQKWGTNCRHLVFHVVIVLLAGHAFDSSSRKTLNRYQCHLLMEARSPRYPENMCGDIAHTLGTYEIMASKPGLLISDLWTPYLKFIYHYCTGRQEKVGQNLSGRCGFWKKSTRQVYCIRVGGSFSCVFTLNIDGKFMVTGLEIKAMVAFFPSRRHLRWKAAVATGTQGTGTSPQVLRLNKNNFAIPTFPSLASQILNSLEQEGENLQVVAGTFGNRQVENSRRPRINRSFSVHVSSNYTPDILHCPL